MTNDTPLIDLTETELAFCAHYVLQERSNSKALIQAGIFKIGMDPDAKASHILSSPHVQLAIHHMQYIYDLVKVQEAEDDDIEDEHKNRKRIVKDLRQITKRALNNDDVESAIKASDSQAKVLGLMVERSSIKMEVRKDPRGMGLRELIEARNINNMGKLIEVPDEVAHLVIENKKDE